MDNDQNIIVTYASSIENVDFAMYEWLDQDLNLSCTTNEGFKKTPVIWVTPERAFQIKNNKEFRDVDGTVNVPLITIERTSIQKDQKNAGVFYANIPPDNRITISRRINPQKTAEFTNATVKKSAKGIGFVSPKIKNNKVVYKFDRVLLPVYVMLTYNISLFSQYQQQMNELLQPFLTLSGSLRHFIIEKNNYTYECFIEQNFDVKNNISAMEEEERRYITNITIKVLGKLVSGGSNEKDSIVKTYENAVEIKFNKEPFTLTTTQESIPEIASQQESGTNVGTRVYSNIPLKRTYIIGDGVNTEYIINHGLNTKDLFVSIRQNFDDFSSIPATISYTNNNSIKITVGSVIALNSHTVTLFG